MPVLNPNDLTGHGLSGLVCQEIAAQVTAGTANPAKLAAAGVTPIAAQRAAARIQGGETNAKNLANSVTKHRAN